MRLLFMMLLSAMLLFSASKPNALIDEDSPYLQQHAFNPVQWLPWGEEAFELARSEHKPIFLSIGYSTCHWCHVMARESFENEVIAELINRYFIPVKVDREEMPHLDSYYQRLYMKVKKRSAHWSLSVMLSEEGEAFHTATYIPSTAKYGVEGMDTLLHKIFKRYRNDLESVKRQATAMAGLMQSKMLPKQADKSKINAQALFASLQKMYDDIYIGFSVAPKYPEASKIALLFDLGSLGNQKANDMALVVLRVMALRGLYDHVEGGFFRYSVDAAWEIPHFEKMLYNQAELIPLYVKAYQKTRDPLFRSILEETIAMTEKYFGKDGLYFSASDADSDHEEGGYFIYTVDEVKRAIANNRHSEELEASLELFDNGNFEGKTHLNLYTSSRSKGFEAFRKELKQLRSKRRYPFVDQKVITAWNAMMIEALYHASKVDKKYGVMADQRLKRLLSTMRSGGILYHQTLFGKEPLQVALLEDYAFTISALIVGYGATYDKEKLVLANQLLKKALKKFFRSGSWYQNDDEWPVSADLRDKYYTSAFGRMVQNLYKMAALEASPEYAHIAAESLEHVMNELESKQGDTPSTAIAYLMSHYGSVVLKHSKSELIKEKDKISVSINQSR